MCAAAQTQCCCTGGRLPSALLLVKVTTAICRLSSPANTPDKRMCSSDVYNHAGTALLDRGRLQSALLLFEEAAALVSAKSDVGGRAALQRAITLDSLGRHDEALKLYGQLRTHRCTSIAKSARSMSFGFQAGASNMPHLLSLFSGLSNPPT
jgi:tetratricopeptide (TPR) repeat protein